MTILCLTSTNLTTITVICVKQTRCSFTLPSIRLLEKKRTKLFTPTRNYHYNDLAPLHITQIKFTSQSYLHRLPNYILEANENMSPPENLKSISFSEFKSKNINLENYSWNLFRCWTAVWRDGDSITSCKVHWRSTMKPKSENIGLLTVLPGFQLYYQHLAHSIYNSVN